MPPALETGRDRGSFEDELFKLVEVNRWSLERSLGCVERLIVHSALRAAGGNQSEAARKLGITPRSIYNKLHRSYDELDRSA
jgi:DNA-binding NtrC family response regulator